MTHALELNDDGNLDRTHDLRLENQSNDELGHLLYSKDVR